MIWGSQILRFCVVLTLLDFRDQLTSLYLGALPDLPAAVAAAKSPQSCPPLCNPIDSSPPGSPTPGTLQARTLEWVAMSSPMHESEKWKWSRSVVSDSSRPHGLQPTRLLRPWDFPARVLEWHAIAFSARFAYLPLLLTTYLVVKYHCLPFARSLYILNLAPFSLCHRLCKSQFKAMFLPMFHYKFVYLF